MFGLDPQHGHIINGHVPVKIKNGESPVKADGRLFVIDGGISKAYQKATGIAGVSILLRYIWWKDLTVGQTFQIQTREGNCFCR